MKSGCGIACMVWLSWWLIQAAFPCCVCACVCGWVACPTTRPLRYRKRLLESDLTGWVSPVVYHADTPIGFAGSRDDPTVSWVSVYFFGPDGELLEIAAQTRDFSPATAAKDIEHMPQKALHLDWKVALPSGAKGKHYAAAVKKKRSR